jgi:hypothetical protein
VAQIQQLINAAWWTVSEIVSKQFNVMFNR